MAKLTTFIGIGAVALTTGCASQTQELQRHEDEAMMVAVRRGQFELGCPTATGVLLSTAMLEPAAWRGTERAEYTIGVSGCGKKTEYIVICPETGTGCVAGGARNNAPSPQ